MYDKTGLSGDEQKAAGVGFDWAEAYSKSMSEEKENIKENYDKYLKFFDKDRPESIPNK